MDGVRFSFYLFQKVLYVNLYFADAGAMVWEVCSSCSSIELIGFLTCLFLPVPGRRIPLDHHRTLKVFPGKKERLVYIHDILQ